MSTIEVQGQQFEIDERVARRIETLKIGTPVRVLTKADYAGKREIYTGVVVGFEPFPDLPTVRIAYFKADYSAASVEFVSFNAQTKDFAFVAAVDGYDAEADLSAARKSLDRKVEKAVAALREAEGERDYFATKIAESWGQVTA
jgi:hypothetical protein